MDLEFEAQQPGSGETGENPEDETQQNTAAGPTRPAGSRPASDSERQSGIDSNPSAGSADPMSRFQPLRVVRRTSPPELESGLEPSPPVEPAADTVPPRQPSLPAEAESVHPAAPPPQYTWREPWYNQAPEPPRRRRRGCGCALLLLPALMLLLGYLLFPLRSNILLIGLDRALEGTDASRTDTNILLSIDPLLPVVNMLSIPRDLWVPIPGAGENRINTAHYFAELNLPGSGPQAAMQTVSSNFGVDLHYYARIRFDGLKDIIDSMGGVTIDLPEAMSGYPAGSHHLDGTQALAFARDRAGSDDFFRMQRGQLLIRSILKKFLNPLNWVYLPPATAATIRAVDTSIPLWQLPRFGVALLRAVAADSINAHTINREMVTPFTTNQGANVLLPNWDAINPLLFELFGQ